MTDNKNNSGAMMAGVIGGVLGGLAAVFLADEKRRGKVMSILSDWKGQAGETLQDVTGQAEKKIRRAASKRQGDTDEGDE